jgi:hypothetical protein
MDDGHKPTLEALRRQYEGVCDFEWIVQEESSDIESGREGETRERRMAVATEKQPPRLAAAFRPRVVEHHQQTTSPVFRHTLDLIFVLTLQGSRGLSISQPCIANCPQPKQFCWRSCSRHSRRIPARWSRALTRYILYMYSVSRPTIKATLLEVAEMLLLGYRYRETYNARRTQRSIRTNSARRMVSLTSLGLCGMQILVVVAHVADTLV